MSFQNTFSRFVGSDQNQEQIKLRWARNRPLHVTRIRLVLLINVTTKRALHCKIVPHSCPRPQFLREQHASKKLFAHMGTVASLAVISTDHTNELEIRSCFQYSMVPWKAYFPTPHRLPLKSVRMRYAHIRQYLFNFYFLIRHFESSYLDHL